MQKIRQIILLILLSLCRYEKGWSNNIFNGLSVGASLGYINFINKTQTNHQFGQRNSYLYTYAKSGFTRGFNLNYGYIFSNTLYLGIEGEALFNKIKTNNTNGSNLSFTNSSICINLSRAYDTSFKVRYKISETFN